MSSSNRPLEWLTLNKYDYYLAQMNPVEGRFTKIGAIAAILALFIAYLDRCYPVQPPAPESVDPTPIQVPALEKRPEPENRPEPEGESPLAPSQNSVRQVNCSSLGESVALKPGLPVQVASSTAVLSARIDRVGSEAFMTLGIASDRETRKEAVLGAPVRYTFKTSQGNFFINVIDLDLAAELLTVQVGCEISER